MTEPVEPLRKSPLQTSPAVLPHQSSERVSPKSGRVLLRHAAAKYLTEHVTTCARYRSSRSGVSVIVAAHSDEAASDFK